MNYLRKIKLEVIVFCSGGLVMIFEIVGSRVLAPYLGNSTFVWTSLIGVILAALSVGNYLGGKLSDKKADHKVLSAMLFMAGLAVVVMNLMKEAFMSTLAYTELDIRWATIYAGFVLFVPASVLLGMVAPYSIRLKLEKLSTSGETVGKLYALSTLGSIVGTFLAGFYLISFFGTTRIIYLVASMLIALSLFASIEEYLKGKLFLIVVSLGLFYAASITYASPKGRFNLIDIDTDYSRVQIFDSKHWKNSRPVRHMQLSKQSASAMYLDGDDLVFEYTDYYSLFPQFTKDFESALLIGGAAYSYPTYFLNKYDWARMDVVEIDPGLTDLASKHFNLDKSNPRLNVYHEDARIFLNRNEKKYDLIFMDAFDSPYSVPVHLVTVETIQKFHDALSEDGVLVVNLIASFEGEKSGFYKSYNKTLSAHFDHIYSFAVDYENPRNVQNIVVMATKTDKNISFESEDETVQKRLDRAVAYNPTDEGLVMTDEFAPIEYYMSKTL